MKKLIFLAIVTVIIVVATGQAIAQDNQPHAGSVANKPHRHLSSKTLVAITAVSAGEVPGHPHPTSDTAPIP